MVAAQSFSRADSLRGALRPERAAFDVVHYALDVELEPATRSVRGEVAIAYRGVFASDTVQLDLAPQLRITTVRQAGRELAYRREAGAVFVGLARATAHGRLDTVTVGYAGQPAAATNPPWDGGLTWAADSLGRAWIGVSCEGIGASQWWPTKDHLGDEPDSASVAVTVPDPLRVVANGRYVGARPAGGDKTRYAYAVASPINNYNLTFYAGHYVTFADTLRSPDRATPLRLRYSVLDYNLARARRHFRQVKPMLRCFEHYLGPYPFWTDGYRLVEAPYLGMEHQSAIAYGNGYVRGYRGGLIPPDMDWDYLIVHESGHEYFGNAVSVTDHAEMWLHESFTTYLEALYVECRYGHADYLRYLAGQRGLIANAQPIVGAPHVNFDDFASSDHYFKGSWVLHAFRGQVGDAAFLSWLRDFYDAHAVGPVTTSDFMRSVVTAFGPDVEPFWRHYLYQAALPRLVVRPAGTRGSVAYFEDAVPGFRLRMDVGGETVTVADQPRTFAHPPEAWQQTLASGRYLLEAELPGLAGE